MRRTPRAVVGLAAILTILATVSGCAPDTGGSTAAATFPATTTAPERPVSGAVGQTRAAIAAALGERGLTLSDTQAPYRPAEAPLLASAPRAVYQAWLPDDPDKGLIVVYEFADAERAAAAAAEQQQYLATGPGRVQSPQGTVHVIRGLATTVIVYDWLPDASKDPTAPGIQSGLETLGISYPVG